ncbi:hypothetical protein [Pleomorphovibrio marinus]|uniref:hypothetical protein n=1 Tax=Pleomorphovibrio marinus TaxID=2164132 RepID=UPI000E0C6910|nr:hypothetical protein [Pleomorphovibrio marinus]
MKKGKQKERLFKIIAVCLPVLLFVGLEAALSWADFGRDLSLFVRSPEVAFDMVNPEVSHRFYLSEENAVTGTGDYLKKVKSPEIYRVMVIGESTALGFPYSQHVAFPNRLRYQLQMAYPDKVIEVINLSLTGINSYALYDFAKEVVEKDPDLVVLSIGHNEYYGALGVGSTSNLGNSPALVRMGIKLRKLKTVQLLEGMAKALGIRKRMDKEDLQENLMKRMVAKQEIPYGSKLFRKGLDQFEANLTYALKVFSSNKVPVYFLGTISNERNQPPFISRAGIEANQAEVEQRITLLNDDLTLDQKANELKEILSLDSCFSKTHFMIGELAFAMGENNKARHHFQRAKEHDNLRFRAPEAINQIAQKVCLKYGARFLSLDEVFRKASPDGILGRELFLEHLHPNLEGHQIMAKVLFTEISEDLMPNPQLKEKLTNLLDFPINKVDSIFGEYVTMMLRENWPFNEPISLPQEFEKSMEEALAGGLAVKQISWDLAMEKLYRHYHEYGDYAEALKVAESVANAYPYNAPLQMKAGLLALRIEAEEKATLYFQKAIYHSPTEENLKRIVESYLKAEKLEAALPHLDALIAQSRDPRFESLKVVILETLALENKVEDEPFEADDYSRLSLNYLKIGNLERAKEYVDSLLAVQPDNTQGLQILSAINERLEARSS